MVFKIRRKSPGIQGEFMSVTEVCQSARRASRSLSGVTTERKDEVLARIAGALVGETPAIVRANAADLGRGREQGMSPGLLDRLRLDETRIAALAQAVRQVMTLPDPVGNVVRGERLPSGLRMRQVRVPMGVVGMIYEARPNVTIDAAVLTLKSGNACVLRGGTAARDTNRALVQVVRACLHEVGLPEDLVTSIDDHGREGAQELMRARGLVDVLIPRGGAGLIQTVVTQATVPVIETGVGNCHVFVDASADPDAASAIVLNSKTHRVGVCNAAETLLVHADLADSVLPRLLEELDGAGVRLHGDGRSVAAGSRIGVEVMTATDTDWGQEYLSMDMAVAVVDDLDAAIDHITRWSSGHTEAIVTRDLISSERFTAEVDSAAVMVNASTRFTDGSQLGLGAEIGISTQKLHARGPMGLDELTTTRWIVTGDGHVRA